MIDINYSDPTSVVRSNIGDPNTRFVSDNTITSALVKYDGDINKASVLIMETMLSHFSVQADESKTDEVEYKYTKLYERFKARLTEFKNETASVKQVPIIIGGTRLSEKNAVANDVDTFLPIFQDQWNDLQYQRKLVEERKLWNV
ncbi:MAG: hypothetical protein GOVbin2917_69 [Prokaryotic dsDNA virus sp.]|jgi:hypothetical protein|nr:MAG: hypothetical protein GOVbin2917_69 [Prokaryotic dsDNA virus sp.]|tara:strand:+ start:57501 stop:57935 length:435 start_codon:yes stop_codon:yes gene_type:complete